MKEDLKNAIDKWVGKKISDVEKSYVPTRDFVMGAEVCVLRIISKFKVNKNEYVTFTAEKVFPPCEEIIYGKKYGNDIVLFENESKKIDSFFEETKKKANEIWS